MQRQSRQINSAGVRRRITAAILVLAAIVLSVSLLRYARDNILTYADGHVTRNQSDDPIITLSWSVADFACFVGQKCKLAAAAHVVGLYGRSGVPRLVTLLTGFIFPLLLLFGAVAMLLHRRWAYALGLGAAAVALNLTLTYYGNDFVQHHANGQTEHMLKGATIHVAKIVAGVDPCVDRSPCRPGTFEFITGLYAAPSVPLPLAIFAGLVLPMLLLASALAVAVWPRRHLLPR